MSNHRWNDMTDEAGERADERERVRDELASRLEALGVKLTGSESDRQIVALTDAVEAFESARALLGGDSMVNATDSSQPDDDDFVLPSRRDDESVDQYLRRLATATDRLRQELDPSSAEGLANR